MDHTFGIFFIFTGIVKILIECAIISKDNKLDQRELLDHLLDCAKTTKRNLRAQEMGKEPPFAGLLRKKRKIDNISLQDDTILIDIECPDLISIDDLNRLSQNDDLNGMVKSFLTADEDVEIYIEDIEVHASLDWDDYVLCVRHHFDQSKLSLFKPPTAIKHNVLDNYVLMKTGVLVVFTKM